MPVFALIGRQLGVAGGWFNLAGVGGVLGWFGVELGEAESRLLLGGFRVDFAWIWGSLGGCAAGLAVPVGLLLGCGYASLVSVLGRCP